MKTHTFETEFTIRDKVFAVVRATRNTEKPCGSCNGQGGAVIPGTKIRVTCDECHGRGSESDWGEYFHVRELVVSDIVFELNYKGSSYKYSAWDRSHYTFSFAYASEEPAKAKAEELNKTAKR